MQRYSIKDLMIATAVVALGLFMAVSVLKPWWEPYLETYWFIVLGGYFGGSAIAGAGLMYPFKKSKLGAWLGVAVGVAFLFFELSWPVVK